MARVHDKARVLQVICDQKHKRTREQGWWTISNTVLSHRAMYIIKCDEGRKNDNVGVMCACCGQSLTINAQSGGHKAGGLLAMQC